MEWIANKFDNIDDEFEVQLEGGEPMIHPEYDKILSYFNSHPKCIKIILTTNGTLLPYKEEELIEYFKKITKPFLLKPSVNHYLAKRDVHIWERCVNIKKVFQTMPNMTLLLNVRRRKGVMFDEEWLVEMLKMKNLEDCSNVFFLQRYGFAKNEMSYELPFIVKNPVEFYLYSPDGKNFDQDLIARSNHMEELG